ncbi:hypothetical protein ACIBH1_45055 [Nonomuraea sp. NPDC050663]|uniref:hypothetical protein n=1 Tax=Nonomuraea sp. NPDC050663 TaxID=3364370 RepID=UPI0037A3BCE4
MTSTNELPPFGQRGICQTFPTWLINLETITPPGDTYSAYAVEMTIPAGRVCSSMAVALRTMPNSTGWWRGALYEKIEGRLTPVAVTGRAPVGNGQTWATAALVRPLEPAEEPRRVYAVVVVANVEYAAVKMYKPSNEYEFMYSWVNVGMKDAPALLELGSEAGWLGSNALLPLIALD